MKKLLLFLLVLIGYIACINSVKADAVYILDTYNDNTSFGLVSFNSSPVDNTFMGQIYGSYSSSNPADFVALGNVETFGAGYLYNALPVNVSGATAGQTLSYILVAWDTASGSTFEQAVANNGITGSSSVASITLASSLDSFNQQSVNNFGSFSVSLATVPEPTTIALGVMGGLALLARRRRNAV